MPGRRPVASSARGSRAAHRSGPLARLGNEPPLDLASATVPTTRHALSIRWLGASVLTGLTGALLLGSAIYVASHGQVTFAEIAIPAPALPARVGAAGAGLLKADKLVRAETVAAAKQTYRAAMTLRVGDREVIKVRPFTRISTGLSLTSGVYATNIPPFNPLRFFAASEPERVAIEPPPETSDAEVSVVKSELSTLLLEPGGPMLGDDSVVAQLAAEASIAASSGRGTSLPFTSPVFLPRVIGAGEAASVGIPGLFAASTDPAFRSIEVRVVPENVTNLPKSGGRQNETAFEDRTVAVRRGEGLESMLRSSGAGADEAKLIANVLGRERTIEGRQFRMLLAPAAKAGEARSVMRVVLFGERGIEAIAALNDQGTYVSVAPPPVENAKPGQKTSESEDDEEQEGTGARLYESLYETALKQELPRQTVDELVRIFGYDVDFQRRVAPGDSFELFYTNDDEGSPDRVEVLSASITLGNDTRRVFRFQNDDGSIDWLDENGRSLKKFLLRKPILDAKLTSGFGARVHPILGYSKGHTGVDWATRIGTPIFAAGNGTVVKVGWMGGYGNRIELQHANGYVTTYNHQSAFARGIAPGVRVRQGQVIGYVGSTGLSTGPHLHYEVLINGRFMDPLKIRVPRGRELDGRTLAEFGRQRDQITALAKRAIATNQLAASEPR